MYLSVFARPAINCARGFSFVLSSQCIGFGDCSARVCIYESFAGVEGFSESAIPYTQLCQMAKNNTGPDGLIIYLIAGRIIFLVVSLIVTVLLNAIAKLAPENQITDPDQK